MNDENPRPTGATPPDGNHCDSEVIAAFVDGELSARERAVVTEHLALCDHCTELVAQTAALTDDPDALATIESALKDKDSAEPAAAEVVTMDRDRSATTPSEPTPRATAPRWLLAAALILALAATTVWWTRSASRLPETRTLVASYNVERLQQLPDDWIDGRWRTLRGGSTSVSAPPTAAFQLGARTVDLAVALRAEDRVALEQLVHRIDDVLEQVEFSATLEVPLLRLQQQLRVSDVDLSKVQGQAESFDVAVRAVTPQQYVEAGRWAAAAHIAALADDREFFQSASWRRGIRLLETEGSDPELTQIAARLVHVDGPSQALDDLGRVMWLLGSGEAELGN